MEDQKYLDIERARLSNLHLASLAIEIAEKSNRTEDQCYIVFLNNISKNCPPSIYNFIKELSELISDRSEFWYIALRYIDEKTRAEIIDFVAYANEAVRESIEDDRKYAESKENP